MWSNWDCSVVDNDFKLLSESGINTVRVFPLWSDFQPITIHRGEAGRNIEYMFGELPLENSSGVSEMMIKRFEKLLDISAKYEVSVIVSLITGWMSSRLFVPPALEGKNHLTDSESIMWQIRFVKYFVSYFKSKDIIVAWDLGNECNVLGTVNSKYEAFLWSSAITNAIKSEDTSRPVVSGMHGLSSDTAFGGNWTIQTQGEICDILTTHPYPLFTEYCDVSGLDSMRSVLHSTAESCYYSDISHKPCLVEEIGTLGPMIAGRANTANFARASMFSALAHSLSGFLWWCSFDFEKIKKNPYNWVALERELGLFDSESNPKLIVKEFIQFNDFLSSNNLGVLPKRDIDAICILTPGSEQWPIAYGCFILAKKAGLEIEFQFTNEPLKDAPSYIIPSLSGFFGPTSKIIDELKAKIQNGSELFITYKDGFISSFEELTGLEIQSRRSVATIDSVVYNGNRFSIQTNTKLFLKATQAETLALDSLGNVVFSRNMYGKGNIFFLSYPIEINCLKKDVEEIEYCFLKELNKNPNKVVLFENPMIGLTEHFISESQKLVIAINHSNEDIEFSFRLKNDYGITNVLYGDTKSIKQHDAVVFEITKG
jgi:endo-1,4-beta-mannosidase